MLPISLAIALIALGAPPAALRQEEDARRVEVAKKRLAPYDGFEMPPVAGRKYILLNDGGYNMSGGKTGFCLSRGWLVGETKEALLLLEPSCRVSTHRRSQGLNDQERRILETWPKDAPKPGDWVELDFLQCLRDRLESRQTPLESLYRDFAVSWDEKESQPLAAYWCLQLGRSDLALRLLAAFDEAKAQEDRDPPASDPVKLLEANILTQLQARAITEASEGRSRPELLKQWKFIASHPDNPWTKVAADFAHHYESMIEEDRSFLDVLPPEAEDKVAYWIFKLRDVQASQHSDPGGVSVFDRFDEEPGPPQPAEELRKLGWGSLPALIAHLDDLRPTRCSGHWRRFAPETYYLLRVGDACGEIFESITGFRLYRASTTWGTMTNDGRQAEAKRAAGEWWKANGRAGEEGWLLRQLKVAGRRDFAASRLLELDAKKHLPRLLAMLADPATERRAGLLEAVAPQLGREHEALAAALLDGADLPGTLAVAKVLRERCGSDAGVPKVADALRRAAAADPDPWCLAPAIEFLATTPTDEVAAVISELILKGAPRLRIPAIAYGASCRHPRVFAALVSALDDKGETGSMSSYPIRVCDQAAEALIRVLAPPMSYPQDRDPAKRDLQIARLKTWWEEHGSKIDLSPGPKAR